MGAMTNSTPRDLTIRLDFLGDGFYSAEVFSDDMKQFDEPTAVRVDHLDVARTSSITAAAKMILLETACNSPLAEST